MATYNNEPELKKYCAFIWKKDVQKELTDNTTKKLVRSYTGYNNDVGNAKQIILLNKRPIPIR